MNDSNQRLSGLEERAMGILATESENVPQVPVD